MNKTKIAVYGSLRRGEYNYDRFGGDNAFKLIKTTNVPNFKLYSLGSYPGIKKSNNSTDKITVDILETDKETAKSIKYMEIGAGYSEENITIDNEDIPIYVYDHPVREESLVITGDWKERNK